MAKKGARKAKGRGDRRPLKRTGGLAIALLVLLVVLMAMALADLASGAKPGPDVFGRWNPYLWSLGLLAVMTPVWLVFVHLNTERLSGSHVTGSPAWTAGIWFVPLVGGLLAAGPLRRVWEASGSQKTLPPRAWAVSFSLAQITMAAALVIALPAYGEALDGMDEPLTEEEELALNWVFYNEAALLIILMDILTVVGSACMAYSVLDIQAVQRTRSAPGGQAAANARA